MSERYTRLSVLPDQLYIEGAPIIIEAGALLKDTYTNNVLLQLKFKNITQKKIKGLTVKVVSFNTKGEKLEEEIEYQYLDLLEERDAYFGQKQAIPLPDQTTRNCEAGVIEVIFGDNTVWNQEYRPWEQLEKPQPMERVLGNKTLFDLYRTKYGEDSKYAAKREKDLWYCTCGAVNKLNEENCHRCFKKLKELENLNFAELRQEADKRIQEEKEKKRKLDRKLSCIAILLVIAAVSVIAVRIWKGVEKENTYKKAIAFMNDENYEAAIEQFNSLDNYKDSAEQLENAKYHAELENSYKKAIAFMNDENYEQAFTLFKELGDFQDSEEKCKELEEKVHVLKKIVDHVKENGVYEEDIVLRDSLEKESFSGYMLDITSEEIIEAYKSRNDSCQIILYVKEDDADNIWCRAIYSSEELNMDDVLHLEGSQDEEINIGITHYYEVPDGWTDANNQKADCRATFHMSLTAEEYKTEEQYATDLEWLEYFDKDKMQWEKIDTAQKIGDEQTTSRLTDIMDQLQNYLEENTDINMADIGLS